MPLGDHHVRSSRHEGPLRDDHRRRGDHRAEADHRKTDDPHAGACRRKKDGHPAEGDHPTTDDRHAEGDHRRRDGPPAEDAHPKTGVPRAGGGRSTGALRSVVRRTDGPRPNGHPAEGDHRWDDPLKDALDHRKTGGHFHHRREGHCCQSPRRGGAGRPCGHRRRDQSPKCSSVVLCQLSSCEGMTLPK